MAVKKEDVIAKCKAFILRIKEFQKKEDEHYIDRCIKDHDWYVKWFWWLGYKSMSKEEMISKIESDLHNWNYPSITSDAHVSKANELIWLAEQAMDGVVYVSRSDAYLID